LSAGSFWWPDPFPSKAMKQWPIVSRTAPNKTALRWP
jgi:hypothetical protein